MAISKKELIDYGLVLLLGFSLGVICIIKVWINYTK